MSNLSRAVFALVLSLISLTASAQPSAPTLHTSVGGFTDVNGNGILDCGEPVEIVAAYATNNSGTPALTGTLVAPAAGTVGLSYQPGSLVVDPDLTVGCQAMIVSGNSPSDGSGQVDFSCPADPLDNNAWTVVVRYRAVYVNSGSPGFTATAHASTSDGKVYDDSVSRATAAACGGAPAQITLTKNAAGPGTPGSVLLYTLTATDTSGLGAGGVQFVEPVPANTTFDAAASSPGWVCSPDGMAGSLCRNPAGNLVPNGTLTRYFAATIDDPLPAGVTAIGNTACVRLGPTVVAACASASVPTAGAGILHLSKTLASGTAAPSATLGFTLTAANTGNQGLAGVVLQETVPANTAFDGGASSPGWVCSPGNGAGASCTLGLGTLAAGGSAVRSFALTIDNPLPAGVTEIANTACVGPGGGGVPPSLERAAGGSGRLMSGGGGGRPSSQAAKRAAARRKAAASSCATAIVPTAGRPALAVRKTLVSGTGRPGSTLVYDLEVQNSGNQGASAVAVTETVPAATSFVASASSPGWSCSPGAGAGAACTLALGGLAAGQTAHATFAVALVSPLPAGTSAVANTGCAALAGGTPVCDTVTSPTLGHPVLSMVKSYSGGPVHAGDTLVFQLAAANRGDQDAAAAVMVETVPAHTTFAAAASSAGWSCAPGPGAGGTCSLALGVLGAGVTVSRSFGVVVDSPLPAGVRQVGNAACLGDADGNSACSQVTTPPAVALAATLQDSLAHDDGSGIAHPGDAIDYVLTVTNPSGTAATGVDVPTTLDPHVSLVVGSTTATAGGTITLGNAPGDAFPSRAWRRGRA
jgi:uncharacterized repeat protein (TIGR01451 family)